MTPSKPQISSVGGRRPSGVGGISAALRRGWPLVLLVALVAVGASLFAMSRREPVYEAKARLLVSPLGQQETALFATDLIRDSGDAATTPDTVAVMLASRATAAEAAANLGAEWTTQEILDSVRIEPVRSTQVLDVIAEHEDPTVAAAIATEFARSAVRLRARTITRQLRRRYATLQDLRRRVPEGDYSQRDRLFSEMRLLQNALDEGGDPTLRFVAPATPPTTESPTSPALVAGLALVGGLAIGLAAAVALDRVRPGRSHAEEARVAA